MKFKSHNAIFVGMALGAVFGVILTLVKESFGEASTNAASLFWFNSLLATLDFFGKTLFIGLLKMIIAPLILVSIVAGVTSIPSFDDAGRIGTRTIAYYVSTTTIAVLIGLVCVLTIQPGRRGQATEIREARIEELKASKEEFRALGKDPNNKTEYLSWLLQKEGSEQGERYLRVVSKKDRSAFEMFQEDIIKPLLMNPFKSLADSNSLGIIFFSLLLGLVCTAVGEPAAPLVNFFRSGNEVMLKLTQWLMSLSPFAVFCLMASVITEYGLTVFSTLGWYCLTVIIAIFVHVFVLLTILRVFGQISPIKFLSGIREAWLIAFATRSSAATLPVTVRCLIENLGISRKVTQFTVPVGATINMDGTALYEGVAIIFLLQIYAGLDDVGATLTAASVLIIFITAVLASVGAAAVPDAGLVTMVLVANAVHLPVYYIPFIFAVDAFLDMFRTSTNVLGDAIGAVVVDRYEKSDQSNTASTAVV